MSRIVLFTEHSNSAPDPVSRSAFLRGRVIGLWLFGLCASLAGPSLTAQDWRASSVPGPSPAVCMKLGPVSPAAGPLTHAKVANVETGKNALPPGTYSFVSIDYSVASWTIFDGINDFGWISGWFNFIPATSPVGDTPVVYRNGQFQVIDIPQSTGGRATGINKKGMVVGAYEDLGGIEHGFVSQGGKVSILDFPGGVLNAAAGINDMGDIVGAYLDASGILHGYLFSGGAFTTLDYPGAAGYTSALGINKSRDIVGGYASPAGTYHGFLYSGGVFTSIDFPQATLTFGAGINDAGDITGWYDDGGGVSHAFVLSGGNFTSIDPPGGSNTFFGQINNKGQVVGASVDNQGEYHSLLATPEP